MKIKPGYRTSEFWFTLVSFIFSGLFLLGIVGDNDQKEELIRDVSHGVESIILIGGQMLILWNYISSRKVAKQTPITGPETLPEKIKETKNDSSKPRKRSTSSTTNKQRSSKSRSRKTNKQHKTKSSRSKNNSSS